MYIHLLIIALHCLDLYFFLCIVMFCIEILGLYHCSSHAHIVHLLWLVVMLCIAHLWFTSSFSQSFLKLFCSQFSELFLQLLVPIYLLVIRNSLETINEMFPLELNSGIWKTRKRKLENGNWKWKLEMETGTEMELKPLRLCSHSKIHVLLTLFLGIPGLSPPPVFNRLLC